MSRFLVINEHPIERTLRVLVGLGLVGIALFGPKTPWGYLGLIPIVTGLSGICPLYSVFGFSTCRVATRKSS
jgi:hypothetical protein